MDKEVKRGMLAALLAPDTDADDVLFAMLDLAEAEVLNRMYPFGYPGGTSIPARYDLLQVQLAAELYSKRGAEGQTSHSENGISRTWPEKSALLKQVLPHVGSVNSDA